jgi:hypothetical protein
MKTFDLPELSRLKLTKATPRKEKHGKELVQAISLRVEWWPTDNAAVNLLHENLQDLLWWVPPEAAAQAGLDGVPAIKKHRRVPTLQMPLKVEAAFSGYTLQIEHGIDDSTALELYSASLDKFEVEAKEGGSVVVRWSMASNKAITPQLVGALCGLEGGEIIATLTPPEPGTTEATGAEIDGTKGHPGAAEGQGSLLDTDTPEGALAAAVGGDAGPEDQQDPDDSGEGSSPDSGAAEQAELEAGMRESLAAAGVKPKRGARAVTGAH